jgi:CBS domain-containing protein
MTLLHPRDIARSATALAPDDSLAKAARLLRARGLPALPVAHAGRLVGLIHEADLAAVASAPDPQAAAASTQVVQLMRPIDLVVGDIQELTEIARMFHDRRASAAPVLASDGRYLGMLLRRDLLAALVGQPPVPPIAGLATPFGVHLTTGRLRAGASDLALFSTGALFMTVVFLLDELAERAILRLGLARELSAAGLGGLFLVYLLQIAAFLVLLRLSPLSGVHAAEHMVVHAIEEGEDLIPEKVRAMSRVHPRCGTNLMALVMLLGISAQLLFSMRTSEGSAWLAFLILLGVALFTWRRLGAGLQRWFTTRPPSELQLRRAVSVGETLLGKVRAQPGGRVSAARRVWSSGFLQMVLGFLVVYGVIELLRHWW